ncbi:MAG: Gfo/Idh/MocA family oxidoreductase [Bryobacterales bacterium]|nr:Gfo/Idh/MocA family oxidoreductase [Bryobacterales bacterium]
MDRRHFLMSSAATGATFARRAMAAPSDTVRVACVGVRGQGRSHIKNYLGMNDVQIAAICDIDESILDSRLADVEKATGKRPDRYIDVRKLLEDKSIDAISIATPNHSHTLQTIWACQAGKDVYVEKPCSHNMFEARQIVAAKRKYKRIVQHGTNSRSGVAIREAAAKIREGLIGDVYMTRGLCFKWRNTIGHTPVESVPAGVHYDLWLGPAPLSPFTRNRFHYNWHWNWNYGNGEIGNQGIHEVDICRWLMGVKYPTKVSAIGGHFMFDDDQQTPNTLTTTYEFNDGGKRQMMVFDVRHWITNHEAGIGGDKPGSTVGNVFYGSKGYITIDGYGDYKSFLGREQTPGPRLHEGGNNWRNFIDVVKSRDESKQNAPIDEGAISTTLVHLANISYRLGRTIHFDAENYRCTGDDEASRMFTRDYRAPFVVPENV